MPIVQELSKKQMADCIREAIRRRLPVVLTCRLDGQWHTLRSSCLWTDGATLWLDYPGGGDERGVPELSPCTELTLSFKLKHHKHIVNTAVQAIGEFGLAGVQKTRAMQVLVPSRMYRVQRRAYHRVSVPRDRSVLATFWFGGLPASEDGQGAHLTWEGWITNMSAGGCQVRVATHGAPDLEVGDLVGIRIDLGQDYEPILVDAQFRQEAVDERSVKLHGFQFLGLNETARGQEMLKRIGTIVCDFQRRQDRRGSSVA